MTNKTSMIVYSGVMIALMAITANIGLFATIGPVPLTLQTGTAVLAGMILGPYYGTLAMIGYLLLGLFGVPVFAGFSSGQAFLSPTAGFLLTFPLVACITGFFSKEKASVSSLFLIAFSALLVHYLSGIVYLYGYTSFIIGDGMTLTAAASLMIPFFLKDVGVILLSVILAIRLRKTSMFKQVYDKRRVAG
ncbi:biotin transporter BioY [Salisediminibacterium selenitireducens]|uniref:Biotin transporter n=1 Tax=Bacillus selenitireducens (strain ATCC 700615 / DSM 15326 / MLS10) TaxID=439292 RepID=D6Y197_BACIE|nr:biotin transporter BioY [Salisediminibacterium selenitireducens]ADH98701.1 BioY protein [[Bacillus] selenitireducens MLS10]